MSAADFDFLHGNWRVSHRLLRQWLAGCDDWAEFTTELTCRPILGGAGNMDEAEFRDFGHHAATIRLYEPGTGEWSLYWISSQARGTIQPPVTGRVTGGTGLFYGREVLNGAPVHVRYTWSDITPGSCRWAQAFSADEGKTWETNWIMDLRRAGAAAADHSGARQYRDADDRA